MPIIRIRDIKPGITNTYTTEVFDSRYLVSDGDMLIGMDGEFNLTKWHSGQALLNQRVCRIQSKSVLLLNDYLCHFLPIALKQIEMRTACVTVKHLSIRDLNAIEIPLASVEKQHAIALQLSSIDEQLGVANKQLSTLDSLVKSRFVEMFGDLEHGYKCSSRKLESIAEVGSSKRVFKNELLAEGVPFYRGTEIAELSAGGSIKPSLFISKEHYERLIGSTGKPEIGDLLLPSICPDGQIWCVNTDTPFYFKDGRVLWIRPDRDAVDGVYLRHALSTMFQMSFSIIASGTTFAELKIFILKELNVPLPELKAQKEFVSFVAQVDKSRFAYIWSRTKSVEQALSGPSLTLVIQHIEPQTRSKYRADVLASPSWPSVDAMLVLKTPHVCVLILVGLVEAIRARCLPGVM